MSHNIFEVKFPRWPTGHNSVQKLHPSGEDKEGLCKQ